MKIICVCFLSLSCAVSQTGQPEYLGEKPYDLTVPDFLTNVKLFYSETPSPYIQTEAEYIGEKENNHRGILYSQRSWLNTTTVATFGRMSFSRMSMVTDLNQSLKAICVSEPQAITENPEKEFEQLGTEIAETIDLCNKQYGSPQTNERNFFSESYNIYTWDADDRLVKIVFPSGLINKEPTTGHPQYQPNEADFHLQTIDPVVSMFIIKKEFAGSIVGRVNSGELLYCQP